VRGNKIRLGFRPVAQIERTMRDPTPQIDHYWMRLVVPMMLLFILASQLIVQPESARAPLLLMGAGTLGMGVALLMSMAIVALDHNQHGRGAKAEKDGEHEASERRFRP
jgi:hypothetical protein